MPSYSNSYFAFFLQTGSRSKPEKRAMTPVCDPCREKSHVSRFFVSLSGRLFPRLGQSGTVVAQSERRRHRSVENRGRYASPASNKTTELKGGDRRWRGATPCPPGTPRSPVHPKQLVPARLRAHRPKRRTPVNITGKAHRI